MTAFMAVPGLRGLPGRSGRDATSERAAGQRTTARCGEHGDPAEPRARPPADERRDRIPAIGQRGAFQPSPYRPTVSLSQQRAETEGDVASAERAGQRLGRAAARVLTDPRSSRHGGSDERDNAETKAHPCQHSHRPIIHR